MHLNGPAIVREREKRGMSQKDLAEVTGLSVGQINHYELGRRANKPLTGRGGRRLHPSVGVKIAEAIGCELEAITGTEPSTARQPEPTEAA